MDAAQLLGPLPYYTAFGAFIWRFEDVVGISILLCACCKHPIVILRGYFHAGDCCRDIGARAVSRYSRRALPASQPQSPH